MKACKECKETKLEDQFYVASRSKTNKPTYSADCKRCFNVKSVGRNRNSPNRKFTYLKYKYGITREEFHVLLESQNGGCAICGVSDNLCVDHIGSKEKGNIMIRGILCNPCNRGLSCFRDNPQKLRKAIEYLCV